jgi:hypothetical protein
MFLVVVNRRPTTALNISRRKIAHCAIDPVVATMFIFGGTKISVADDDTAASSFSSLSQSTTTTSSSIGARFESEILTIPPITAGTTNSGHDNLYFPQWMEGTWDVTQTLISTKTPIGLKFVGGPNGSMDIATKTMTEQTNRINEKVKLKLRFVNTKFGVAEDRVYNWRSRLDAFAGKSVVASVSYANVRESNRASVLAAGGSELDPLTTTVVYFKGPAAQKTFVISHGQDSIDNNNNNNNSDKIWSGYELDRSIFALTNQNSAPPITTDGEILYQFKYIDENNVEGRLRLAEYLNPQSDQLYFEARNRAVSINDYTLSLTRIITT